MWVSSDGIILKAESPGRINFLRDRIIVGLPGLRQFKFCYLGSKTQDNVIQKIIFIEKRSGCICSIDGTDFIGTGRDFGRIFTAHRQESTVRLGRMDGA